MNSFSERLLANDLIYDENILNNAEAAIYIIITSFNVILVLYEIFNIFMINK